ncbi:MAG TPA: RnfABCDGE type electron transport complex subunit D [Arenimonas sp.]|nr:RnfABCDGE type electron transport complex subunit D [Arenimonas sp.]
MRQFDTGVAPHLPPRRSVTRLMALVLACLLPGALVQAWCFGPGVILQILLAVLFALLLEAAMLQLRGRPLQPFLTDLSAPLTAALFALSLPPLAPWWLAAVGMVAAIVVGKHLYGGLGHNPFNPAMVGVAVVLLCFPLEYTQWLQMQSSSLALPGWRDSLLAILGGELPSPWQWDAISGATPLDVLRQLDRSGAELDAIVADPAWGLLGGRGWEWIAAAYALGGIALIARRAVPWQTPAAVIGSVIVISLPLWWLDPTQHLSPWQHLFSGGLMLCAFFIATDPVSGCTTARGRWLFGCGVGALVLAIRRWGGYPEGVAFAILLMNCAAPWLDRYSRPRIYGEAKR